MINGFGGCITNAHHPDRWTSQAVENIIHPEPRVDRISLGDLLNEIIAAPGDHGDDTVDIPNRGMPGEYELALFNESKPIARAGENKSTVVCLHQPAEITFSWIMSAVYWPA